MARFPKCRTLGQNKIKEEREGGRKGGREEGRREKKEGRMEAWTLLVSLYKDELRRDIVQNSKISKVDFRVISSQFGRQNSKGIIFQI